MFSVWLIVTVAVFVIPVQIISHKDFQRGNPLLDVSRARLVKESNSRLGVDGSCGMSNCSPYEKCCNSNGIFSTCCPFSDGICCGPTECCQNGQTCCGGKCCPAGNHVCCYTYCCSEGHRCSGPNGNCVPYGRGSGVQATLPNKGCSLVPGHMGGKVAVFIAFAHFFPWIYNLA